MNRDPDDLDDIYGDLKHSTAATIAWLAIGVALLLGICVFVVRQQHTRTEEIRSQEAELRMQQFEAERSEAERKEAVRGEAERKVRPVPPG